MMTMFRWMALLLGAGIAVVWQFPNACSGNGNDISISTETRASTQGPGRLEAPPLPIGPVTQAAFNQVLDALEYSRIGLQIAMPDEVGTGLYYTSVNYFADPSSLGSVTLLSHRPYRTNLEYSSDSHYIEYYRSGFTPQDVIDLLNLMRQRGFFDLAVTRDPNGGPDRYTITTGINYTGADYTLTHLDTNVRDTSPPDNAAYFEVIDFIKQHFITPTLSTYQCRVEYNEGHLVSQSGPGCPTLP